VVPSAVPRSTSVIVAVVAATSRTPNSPTVSDASTGRPMLPSSEVRSAVDACRSSWTVLAWRHARLRPPRW
jgi:hypothetical protein